MGSRVMCTAEAEAASTTAALMARMARGDESAVWIALRHWHDDLAIAVRRILADLRRSDVVANREDFDFLVVAGALVIFDRAAGWDPAGAKPWTWAWSAIRAEVVSWLGNATTPFDAMAETADQASPTGADIDLGRLAAQHPRVANWLHAVGDVASERDRTVHVDYQVQKHLGDPSPARTVAAATGLTPANVRQIDRRVRCKLADRSDPELAWLACT